MPSRLYVAKVSSLRMEGQTDKDYSIGLESNLEGKITFECITVP